MQELARGAAEKMNVSLASPVQYQMRLGDAVVSVNGLLGRHIQLEYLGTIHCIHCQRKTSKSFAQGYCWSCFRKLARCDICIMSPEKCHFTAGTCREPQWGEQFCMTEHIVYLANSSGIKVGITHASQLPTRWLDQGASQALPIFRVQTRQQSGFIEDILRTLIPDRTNWRVLLREDSSPLDLPDIRDQLFEQCAQPIAALQQCFGLQAIQMLDDAKVLSIAYPILEYPKKISSFNLDKAPLLEGVLQGIKGQYLLFDTGVINIRKYTAYQLALRCVS